MADVLEHLTDYQRDALQKLLDVCQCYKGSADLSDTGTGKTWIAAALLKSFSNLPSLVVCPKIAISHWKRVLEVMKVPAKVINYEKLIRGTEYYDPHGVTKWTSGVWDTSQVKMIVWDEAHRAKSRQTKTTHALLTAVRSGIRNHLISASLVQEPLDCRAIGECLGIFQRGCWSVWLKAMGYQVTPWGWEWRVSGERRLQVLKGLHELIMRRAIRIRWTDVQGFPERYVNWKLIDLPDSARKRIRECLDLIEEDSSLTTLLRFRQAVERYKLPAYVEIINDYVEQGISVVCWVEWLESLDTLRQAIQNCGVIFGDTPESERRTLIDKFQSNELKVLLLQTKVGGESLSLGDETGLCPRVGLISPTWSARDLLQILGRLHRMNAKSPARYYILYAAGTVEETVCKKVGQKLVRLQTSTDGGLTDFDLIPDILLKKLLKYKEKS